MDTKQPKSGVLPTTVFEGDQTDFRERVIWVIRLFAGKPTRYTFLEERFGISARKWQNVCNRAQQPSIEMVAALATVYPYFVFWLITGSSKTVVQVDPRDSDWFEKTLNSFDGHDLLKTLKDL